MSKELPFFQFEPAQWKFGRIQRMPDKVKVAFIDLLCKYWHENNQLSKENAQLDFGFEEVEMLIKYKIIEVDKNENIIVKFLDIQLEKITGKAKINSEKGKASAAKKLAKKQAEINTKKEAKNDEKNQILPEKKDEISKSTVVKDVSTAVENNSTAVEKSSTDLQPNSTDKIRGDKMRKDEIIIPIVFSDEKTDDEKVIIPEEKIASTDSVKAKKITTPKTPPSPSKTPSTFSQCAEVYNNFIIENVGVKAIFNAAEGKALKLIIAYLEKEVNEGETVPEAFKLILDNKPKWDRFHQNQLKLIQINSNLINILNSIKNGKSTQSPAERKQQNSIEAFNAYFAARQNETVPGNTEAM